jgi:hypothetical protein
MRLSAAIVSAIALAFVPAATAATGELTVSVSKLTLPKRLQPGKMVTFGVRYIVRGPLKRRANATVEVRLSSKRNRYRLDSDPSPVRPAIWSWSVRDRVPPLALGTYNVTATVTLRRSGTVIYTTKPTTATVVVVG